MSNKNTYAIIETGSKQYRVEPQTLIDIEKIEIPEGQKEVALDKVLFIRSGDQVHVGVPFIKGAKVICDYIGAYRGDKVISFRFRRRKNSRKKIGHRQNHTRLRVKEIQL